MATTDIDLTLYFKKKRTPPPSVLLLAVPNEKTTKDQASPTSPTAELRSRQQKKRQITPHTVGAPANHADNQESLSLSSYGWHRHSDKAAQIAPAPDVAYRNTYLEESRKDRSINGSSDYLSRSSVSRSPSPRSQHSLPQPLTRLKTANITSSNSTTSDSSPKRPYHQYRTVYDYIRESIKQIERQRNLKQNFSTRVKRPQNDDAVLRRVLGEKKNSSISKRSTFSRNDLRNPQSLVNYVNHSREQIRVLHTTTPNQQPQMSPKSYRQRTNLSQHQNDSLDKQRALMMTTTVGNS